MNKLKPVSVKNSKERVILVLTPEKHAWYFVSSENELTLVSTQAISNGKVDIPEQFLLSDDARQLVELVVDTPVDDLDRAKVVECTLGYFQRFQTTRALWNLSREYVESEIFKLPTRYFPNIASILHTSLPKHYQHFIENIQEQGLVVSHMTTCTQLLSRSIKINEPCLFIFPCGANQQRLMLIDTGVVVFMRILSVELGEGGISDKYLEQNLEESLDYLVKTKLLKSREVLVTLASIQENDQHSSVSLENYLVSTYHRGIAELVKYEHESKSIVNKDNDEDSLNLGVKKTQVPVFFWIRHYLMLFRSWNHKTKLIGTFKPYQVTDSLLKHHDVLKSSRSLMQSYSSLLLLRRVTIGLAVITFLSVLLASFYSVRQIRGLNLLNEERASLKAEIVELRSALTESYETPFFTAATLKGNKAFAENLKGSPQSVLTLVATLMQDFPSIQLQSLSWSIFPHDSDEETVVSSLIHTAGRSSFNSDESKPEKLSITFEGAFEAATSLRVRQKQLDDFSRSLSDSELVSGVSILNSPVESAGASESFNENDDLFRVRFWADLP